MRSQNAPRIYGKDTVHKNVGCGHRTHHGNYIAGPAVIEQVNTTLLLTCSYDCICDTYGSFAVFEKGQEGRLSPSLQEMVP